MPGRPERDSRLSGSMLTEKRSLARWRCGNARASSQLSSVAESEVPTVKFSIFALLAEDAAKRRLTRRKDMTLNGSFPPMKARHLAIAEGAVF